MSYYYNIDDDIAKYPDAWCYVIVGGRNTGKTYGALKSCYLNKRKFVFVKRTNKDVMLLCAGSGSIGNKRNQFGMDLSPFKSINRDLNCNVSAFSIADGLGGFWECVTNEDGEKEPEGDPIGTLISLNSVSKFAGFDMSDADWIIFDEFIPRSWEKVSRKEGDQLMDLYKTISRDREHRGRAPLKLICLANAVNISNPVSNMLEVTDSMAYMSSHGMENLYIPYRGIYVHILQASDEFIQKEQSTMIYKAMHDTDWGRMAFDNDFAYNDFSNVKDVQLKGFKPVCTFIYKGKPYYVHMKDGKYSINFSRHNSPNIYDLHLENDQKRFYNDYAIDLRNECIDGNVTFKSYTAYDLIVNYHKIFNLR